MLPDPGDVGPIGEVIRDRRSELQLSQADLADRICRLYRPTVTGIEVARWERAKRIPRSEARRALEQALGIPLGLLDLAAGVQQAARKKGAIAPPVPAELRREMSAVEAIRIALFDAGSPFLVALHDEEPPSFAQIEAGLDEVMVAYQSGQFERMLSALPAVLADANRARARCQARERARANRLVALSSHAGAKVLSKLGEFDLAWIACQNGLSAAEGFEDQAVVGSLRRSVIHTLQSQGRSEKATQVAERGADDLRRSAILATDQGRSVYGTFLLANAMAAARAGDTTGSKELLDEADHHATKLGRDANHLWTAFGPSNVAVHRVATAVALDDTSTAERHVRDVDVANLPTERQVRFLFDLALIAIRRDRNDDALTHLLRAEQLAPDHVHHHRMGQQIVSHLRATKQGRQDPRLAQLDRRTRKTLAAQGTGSVG